MGRRAVQVLSLLAIFVVLWFAFDLGDLMGGGLGADDHDALSMSADAALAGTGEGSATGPGLQGRPGGARPEGAEGAGGLSPLAALVAGGSVEQVPLGALPVHGRVVDARGHASSDVKITVLGPAGREVFTTDADGAFDHALVPGRYRVLLEGGRDGSLYVPAFLVDGTLEDIEWTLRPTASAVVILTSAGVGIGGQTITAELVAGDTGASPLLRREATTNFDGSARIDDLAVGEYRFAAKLEGGLVVAESKRINQDTTVTLKLGERVTFTGQVRAGDAEGPPVEGALVTLSVSQGRNAGDATLEALTDGDGRFTLEVPRGRASSIRVEADGFADWPGARWDGATSRAMRQLRNAAPVHVDIVLDAGGALAGRVLDADGRPVPGVEVEARLQRQTALAGSARSGEEGEFAIANLAGGRYDLAIGTDGVLPANNQNLQIDVPRQAGATVRRDIVVIAARRVTGTVMIDDQTPAIGAHVWLFGGGSVLRSARQSGRTLETWTDTSGRFSLFDVPADRGVTVRAKLRDQEADPYRLPDDASGDGLVLVLAPTSVVSGRVLDQRTGQPIARAAVYLRPGKVGPAGRNQHRVTTNAEGRYAVYSVLPGEWTIFAAAGGYLAAKQETITLERAGDRTVDLQLDPGIVLEGTVVDERGRLLPNVQVVASPEGNGPRASGANARTDRNGAFRVSGLAYERAWRLRAAVGGRVPAVVGGFTRSDSRIRLVLEPVTPKR